MIEIIIWLIGIVIYNIINMNNNNYKEKREQNFINKSQQDGTTWYIDKDFRIRDLQTNALLWKITKNGDVYLCYYPTEKIYINLTEWNNNKENNKNRIKAKINNKLGYHKILSKHKMKYFGCDYYKLICEINENGKETGKYYEIGYKNNIGYYIRYYNLKNKKFEDYIAITKEEYERR